MKPLRILTALVVAAMALVPMQAQEKVKRAFESFYNTKGIEVSKHFNEQHEVTLPDRPLSLLLNVYNFKMDKGKRRSLDNVLTVLENERNSKNCYSVSSRTAGDTNQERLVYSNDTQKSYVIGEMKNSHYMCILLLDPKDTTHSHRYAYAVEWVENGGMIEGKLVETYGSIPSVIQNKPSGNLEDFMRKFNFQIKKFPTLKDKQTRTTSSMSLLNMCRQYKHVFVNRNKEREQVIDSLQSLINSLDSQKEWDAVFFLQQAMETMM